MMFANLMRAELYRLAIRRRVVWMLVLLVGSGLLIPGMWMNNTRPLTEQQVAQGVRPLGYDEIPECWVSMDDVLSPTDCESITYQDVWAFEDIVNHPVTEWSFMVGLLLLFLCIFYVGSDFTSGSLTTQLTFTPQRGLLTVARAVATGLLGGAAMLLHTGSLLASSAVWYAVLNGLGAPMSAPDTPLMLGGLLVVGIVVGMVACLFVFLCGNAPSASVVVLGILVADLVSTDNRAIARWLSPIFEVQVLVTGRATLVSSEVGGTQGSRDHALLYLAGCVLILGSLTVAVFRRRDIKR